MAITILNSANSFIRFDEVQPESDCLWGDLNFCLPVFEQSDVHFQWVVSGTEAEIDALCTLTASEVSVALVSDCGEAPLMTFAEKPARYRLSLTQILYNWDRGLPNFTSVIEDAQCFRIQVTINSVEFCSNCLERITDDCYTSVIEYGNDEDIFGFKYCFAGNIDDDIVVSCEPTIVNFMDVATLAIPYTASLKASYGNFPTVQAWIYDGMGQLVNMGITIGFDGYPPTVINLDFGGNATGIVIIR